MVTRSGPVHFIYLGGPWRWQYDRAVQTARNVHGASVWIWRAVNGATVPEDEIRTHATNVLPLDLPSWLRDHPIQLANVKDYYAWKILHEHGGLYLDLDTISLRPVWDLLTSDVLVSSEWEPGFEIGPRYNSAVVAAMSGSPMLKDMSALAERRLRGRERRWGGVGPWLLTEIAPEYPDAFTAAPMPLLNGWRDDTIHRYYAGERPGPDVRVVHLYSSSNMDAFLADRWMP